MRPRHGLELPRPRVLRRAASSNLLHRSLCLGVGSNLSCCMRFPCPCPLDLVDLTGGPAASPVKHPSPLQISWTLSKLLDALLGSEHKAGLGRNPRAQTLPAPAPP
jgi:hypothetical protein